MWAKKPEKLYFLWAIPPIMAKNLDNEGFRSIIKNYDIFYIDLWGVIHNGITLYKDAIQTLEEIDKVKKNMFY